MKSSIGRKRSTCKSLAIVTSTAGCAAAGSSGTSAPGLAGWAQPAAAAWRSQDGAFAVRAAGAPNDIFRVARRVPEADMDPRRPHISDARANAVRAVRRSRSDEPREGVEVARIGELERSSFSDEIKIGGVAVVVTMRARAPPARSRLTAGRHVDDVNVRVLGGGKKHGMQLGADWPVADLPDKPGTRRYSPSCRALLPRPNFGHKNVTVNRIVKKWLTVTGIRLP